MTPLQKQALFTLRQALALCDEAGIEISGYEMFSGSVFLRLKTYEDGERLTLADIDEFEKELGDD